MKNQYENNNETKKDVKLINFKNLPSVFFVLSLIILSIMIVKFYPKFKTSFDLENTSNKKFEIEYFSFTFRNLDNISKVFIFLKNYLINKFR